jgi:hypothetical protein
LFAVFSYSFQFIIKDYIIIFHEEYNHLCFSAVWFG